MSRENFSFHTFTDLRENSYDQTGRKKKRRRRKKKQFRKVIAMSRNYNYHLLLQLLIRVFPFSSILSRWKWVLRNKCSNEDNNIYFRLFRTKFFQSIFCRRRSTRNPAWCVKTSIKVLEASSLKSLFYGHPRVSKIIPRNLSGSGFVDFHCRTGSHPKLGDLNCLRWLFKSFSFLLFFYFEEKLNLTDCLSENWTSFLSSNSIIYSFFNYSWILTANKSCFFFFRNFSDFRYPFISKIIFHSFFSIVIPIFYHFPFFSFFFFLALPFYERIIKSYLFFLSPPYLPFV